MENNVYFIFHRKDSCTFLDFETNLTSVKLERKEENEVQLKVSTDYAIRIVLYIAIKKGYCPVERIIRNTWDSPKYSI